MKKLLCLMASCALLVGCTQELESRLSDVESRLAKVEDQVKELNSQVSLIQQLLAKPGQESDGHGPVEPVQDPLVNKVPYSGQQENQQNRENDVRDGKEGSFLNDGSVFRVLKSVACQIPYNVGGDKKDDQCGKPDGDHPGLPVLQSGYLHGIKSEQKENAKQQCLIYNP